MTDSIPTRVDDAATKRQVHRAASAGTRIGPYKVLDVLGEGGFGVVYLAEQTEPIRRRVAVKVIKLGMDSKQILARFEAERQALALMDHPNVARVLDAGITEDGRPYFVMEHVPGVSITEHCDRNRLSIDDRIELFISVCEAVQHAHQKGIIHRDIKPSNILVSVNDTNAAPKVIDFGVAKALSQRLSKDTIFTEQGQIIGTPEYMSPEQAEMTAQDIDTRSDIYALGVVLYELLTGTRPFDLERVALLELQRVIRDEEPPRPSTRLSSLGDASAASAKRRRIDPKALVRNLRGDLDWIVMKCIEKDRTRRYEAATGLAEDLRRHLNDEPVLAGPPSAAYRMTKFVRRNRGAVVATGIVSAGLLVSTVISIAFAISEAEQRGVADLRTREANAAREAERTAKEESQQRAEELQVRTDQLQQVADFQSDQLSAIVPELMGRRLREAIVDAAPDDASEALRTTLEQINFTSIGLESLEANVFDPALDAITEQFEGQPVVQAQLRYALAATALQLGLTDFAATPMQQSLAARREALGDDHPETLMSINGMGALLRAEGRLAAAEPYLREALERRRRVLGDDHSDTLGSINNLGTMLQDQGRFDEAEPFCRAALEARRRIFGDDHPDTLRSLNNLGALLYRQGRYDAAEPYYREALEACRRLLGDDHPDTLRSINNLATMLWRQGKLDDAVRYLQEAVEGRRRVLGADHPMTLTSVSNLAHLLQAQGRFDEAELMSREALDARRRLLGDDHPKTLISMNNMGVLLLARGRPDDAETYFREAVEIGRRALGDDHPETLSSIRNLGGLLHRQGRLDAAEPYCREAVEIARRIRGPDHPDTLRAIVTLGNLLNARGRYADSEPFLHEAIETGARLHGPDDWRVVEARSRLGEALVGLERFDEAEPLLVDSYAALEATIPERDRAAALAAAADRLVTLYEALGNTNAADAWRTTRDELVVAPGDAGALSEASHDDDEG